LVIGNGALKEGEEGEEGVEGVELELVKTN
jgi:hypothetical protein